MIDDLYAWKPIASGMNVMQFERFRLYDLRLPDGTMVKGKYSRSMHWFYDRDGKIIKPNPVEYREIPPTNSEAKS